MPTEAVQLKSDEQELTAFEHSHQEMSLSTLKMSTPLTSNHRLMVPTTLTPSDADRVLSQVDEEQSGRN